METDQINTIPLTEKVVEKNPFTDLVDEFEKSLKVKFLKTLILILNSESEKIILLNLSSHS